MKHTVAISALLTVICSVKATETKPRKGGNNNKGSQVETRTLNRVVNSGLLDEYDDAPYYDTAQLRNSSDVWCGYRPKTSVVPLKHKRYVTKPKTWNKYQRTQHWKNRPELDIFENK